MNCTNCGGRFVAREIRFGFYDEPAPMLIDNVPAEVCERCGEEVFADEVVGEFEKMRAGDYAPTGHVQVPLYDYRRLLRRATEPVTGDLPESLGWHPLARRPRTRYLRWASSGGAEGVSPSGEAPFSVA